MYDCTVLDGAVIVHILSTKAVSIFSEYAEQVFIPYLIDQLRSSMRHLHCRQSEGVYPRKERKGIAQKSNQAPRQLDGLFT